MKNKILNFFGLVAFLAMMGFAYVVKNNKTQTITRAEVYKDKPSVFCSPDWASLNSDSLALKMVPLPGWGNYTWKINTQSDSAQFYFNQGINMYYAFHIIEAMYSFKKAQLFDDKNPMIYWAQALAYGPNINDFVYVASVEAFSNAQKAKQFYANATDKEKSLIDAMQTRYSADTSISRKTLNAAYAESMKSVYNRNQNDADVAALYADALLIEHPWEYWKHNGQPESWTPRILKVLEKGLHQTPNHPGLNHYYIHAIEASPDPGKALASADRLGILMPQVSHMVHMPSHIYIRTGKYDQGIAVNNIAVNAFSKYISLFPEVGKGFFLYDVHNRHMHAACAMFKPNYRESIKSASFISDSVLHIDHLLIEQPIGNVVQYVYMTPHFVNVRYGKWNELLKDSIMSEKYVYAHVLSLWAHGMAFANTGNIKVANDLLSKMEKGMKHPELKIIMHPFNSAYSAAQVAKEILQGSIYENNKDLNKAISSYRQAVIYEDALTYTEPRDWLIPSRHFLANALIKQKKYSEAEKFLLEDLKQNPSNFYALYGMEKVLMRQGKKTIADKYKKQLAEAFKDTDMKKPALIY